VIKLCGNNLKCVKDRAVWIHLVAFVIPYSKLIGWEIEGRELIRLSLCEFLDGKL
jgi:hypothetical protein